MSTLRGSGVRRREERWRRAVAATVALAHENGLRAEELCSRSSSGRAFSRLWFGWCHRSAGLQPRDTPREKGGGDADASERSECGSSCKWGAQQRIFSILTHISHPTCLYSSVALHLEKQGS